MNAPGPGTIELTSQDGTRRILGYQPVTANPVGLYISFGLSTAEAFAPVYASTWRSLAFAGVGALAAFALAWWVGDRLFRRPILRMLATIASWRAGDESARSGISGDGTEITALAHSIDGYMDTLAETRAARAAAERHRTLLLREMNHRIKNILAAVQAIANQTFKGEASAERMDVFGQRLAAMAAANDLLVSDNWESAELRASVETAIAPFSSDRPGRFALDGPPVRISAEAAMAFAMALHELCTNAAKYGALSAPEGSVAVRWRLAPGPEGGAERLQLSWTERGGPPVSPPGRRGFGTRLIETALASGLTARTELAYDPAGLCFTLDADAAALLAPAPGREGLTISRSPATRPAPSLEMLGHEVDEGAQLRLREAALRIDRVDAEHVRRPVGQHLDQPPGLQRVAEHERGDLRDAEPRLGRPHQRLAVVDGQPPADPDLPLLAATGRAAARNCRWRELRIVQQPVPAQVVDRCAACPPRRDRPARPRSRCASSASLRALSELSGSAPMRIATSKPSAISSTKRSSSTMCTSTSG